MKRVAGDTFLFNGQCFDLRRGLLSIPDFWYKNEFENCINATEVWTYKESRSPKEIYHW
jgi:hypothetical protein